jgi:D-sedoheptulose 7-phosphate isomerase
MQADEQLMEHMDAAAWCIARALKCRKKILIAGNGGSAAHAQHFAAELVGFWTLKRKRPALAVLALTTDTSVLTALSNDMSFDTVFSRQVEAHGRVGDVFVGITTSGTSPNIIAAVAQARRQRMKTICLLGRDGGAIRGLAHHDIIVPAATTPFVQDGHQWIIHSLCEAFDRMFAE